MTRERLEELVRQAVQVLVDDLTDLTEGYLWDTIEQRRTVKWLVTLAEQYKNPDPDFEDRLKEVEHDT